MIHQVQSRPQRSPNLPRKHQSFHLLRPLQTKQNRIGHLQVRRIIDTMSLLGIMNVAAVVCIQKVRTDQKITAADVICSGIVTSLIVTGHMIETIVTQATDLIIPGMIMLTDTNMEMGGLTSKYLF